MAPLSTYTSTTTIQEKSETTSETMTLKDTSLCDKSSEKNVPVQSSLLGFRSPLKWTHIIIMVYIHYLVIYGLCTYDWTGGRLILLNFIIGSLAGFGITAGAHRLWCHRSYKATLPMRIFLMLCFSTSGQNSLVQWVKDHRVHHKYSETDADPHNSRRGFFFAHVGWLMMHKHPDVIKKGNEMDFSDLYADPVVVFHEKYYVVLKTIFAFIIPIAIPPLMWGESWYWAYLANNLRFVINLNAAFTVNSVAHMWGYKPYDKRINAVENTFVSYLALGEGWHNYHHTFPWDYRASELGYYFNVTTLTLDMLAKLGLVYDLKKPSDNLIKKMAEQHGDGTVYECLPEEAVSNAE